MTNDSGFGEKDSGGKKLNENGEDMPENTVNEDIAAENQPDKTEVEENTKDVVNESSAESERRIENEGEVEDELAALKAEELIARIHDAQSKADENWNLALRAQAEMENVRRRSERDVDNARKYGVEKLANDLLPVIDSMEMGLQAAIEGDTDDELIHKIREGMELTIKMMLDALGKANITVVSPAAGETFNPQFHQAMSIQEVPGQPTNSIVAVMQKGYLLNDRLLRPAMVMVAK